MLFTAQPIWINIILQNEELLSEEKSLKDDLLPQFWVWERGRNFLVICHLLFHLSLFYYFFMWRGCGNTIGLNFILWKLPILRHNLATLVQWLYSASNFTYTTTPPPIYLVWCESTPPPSVRHNTFLVICVCVGFFFIFHILILYIF